MTQKKASVSHYHCQVERIKAVEPFFDPQALRVPVDMHSCLQAIHRDYFSGQFGLSLCLPYHGCSIQLSVMIM